MSRYRIILFLSILLCGALCRAEEPAPSLSEQVKAQPLLAAIGGEAITPARISELKSSMCLTAGLHKALPAPGEGDWRAEYKEKEQPFRQYANDGLREEVTPARRFIYVQPLGTFSKEQTGLIRKTAAFLALFYGLRVKLCQPVATTQIPAPAYRYQKIDENGQLGTDYLLGKMLKPSLPRDAALLMGITSADLWPGRSWNMNYVYGMTYLYGRVGVMSLYRLGNPAESRIEKRQTLLRMLKIASHETAHAFSLRHCVKFECGMNGRKGHFENERTPLWFCHECMAKLCLATGVDPVKRYHNLARFCKKNGLRSESAYYQKALSTLSVAVP